MKKKVLIVGAGLAGCYLATLLQADCAVTIISKGTRMESDSMLAQGGIAAALDPGDTPARHAADTLAAGQYHNSIAAVKQLVTTGPQLIEQLIQAGMAFDHDQAGHLDFGLEGAHSCHRVLHARGDQTGAALTSFVQEQLHHVHWLTETNVLQLVVAEHRCVGVVVRPTGERTTQTLLADVVILATGGLGNLYPYTTNDATVTGDGFALALRANVALSDMAYVQFHPTLLKIGDQCAGLVTEAIRGSGAILVDENDQRIMAAFSKKDLSPRDVVARQLTFWQSQGHQLFLDISAVPHFSDHFIGVSANLDHWQVPFRTTKRIPIQPGAHFMMGGIRADLNGQTSLPGLFAIGEVACNGVHGANRLASNSLLDCLVSAKQVALTVQALTVPTTAPNTTSSMDASKAVAAKSTPATTAPNTVSTTTLPPLPSLAELQDHAWANIGIVRHQEQLHEFIQWLAQFQFAQRRPDQLADDELTVTNLGLCAQLIAQAAAAAPYNLGANYLEEVVHP